LRFYGLFLMRFWEKRVFFDGAFVVKTWWKVWLTWWVDTMFLGA